MVGGRQGPGASASAASQAGRWGTPPPRGPRWLARAARSLPGRAAPAAPPPIAGRACLRDVIAGDAVSQDADVHPGAAERDLLVVGHMPGWQVAFAVIALPPATILVRQHTPAPHRDDLARVVTNAVPERWEPPCHITRRRPGFPHADACHRRARLRLPLAGITGTPLTLRQRREQLSQAAREDLLELATAQAARLDRLIEELPLAAAPTTATLAVREPVDAAPLARDAVRLASLAHPTQPFILDVADALAGARGCGSTRTPSTACSPTCSATPPSTRPTRPRSG